MSEDQTGWMGFGLSVALAAGGVLAGRVLLEPLSPTTTPFLAIPPLMLGLYLLVSATWIRDQGAYGAVLGGMPDLVHLGVQLVGAGGVGLAVLVVLRLPPAGASDVVRTLPRLDAFCHGDPEVRVERELIPTANTLLELRAGQAPTLQAQLDLTLMHTFERCAAQASIAFDDPRGTHSSWRKLREWWLAHPDQHAIPADHPVWRAEFKPREAPEPSFRPVEVLLE